MRRTTAAVVCAIVLALPRAAHAQEPGQEQPPQPHAAAAIWQSGLLPIYGVDLDGPVSLETLQNVWPSLAPLGAGVVRFDVDVRDAASVETVARLCAWALANGVKLLPVLIGANAGEPLGAGFAAEAGGFVTALGQSLRGDPAQAGAYQQVLGFQIGRALNDSARHGGMTRETALLRLLQTAQAVRKAEAPLIAEGIAATPILFEASFDTELKAAGLDPNAEFSDAAYAAALAPLTAFVTEAAASPDIDLIAIEYLPGTAAPGDAGHLARLAADLASPAQGRKIIVVTGQTEQAAFPADRQRFYALAFANLADQRAGEGPDSALAGVVFRWALDDPAREALGKIAQSVSEAHAATPPEEQPPPEPAPSGDAAAAGDPALVTAVKDKVQQFMLGLLDRSLERLGSGMFGGNEAEAAAPAPDPSAVVPADPMPAAAPQIVFGDVAVTTSKPAAGAPVQIDALVYNKSDAVAAEGLTVILVDETGSILNADTMSGDVLISPADNRMLHVTWTPAMPGPQKAAVAIADASLTEIAKSPLFTINVAPPALETDIAPAPGGASASSSLAARVPPGFPLVTQLKPGAASQIAVTLRNPYRTSLKATTITLAGPGMKPVTKTISSLAPGQTRSLTFAGAALARGAAADVQITMKMGAKSATITSRMLLPAVMPPAIASAPSRAPVRSPLIVRAPSKAPASPAAPPPVRNPPSSPAPTPPRQPPVSQMPPVSQVPPVSQTPPVSKPPVSKPPPSRVPAPTRPAPPVPQARAARPDLAILDASHATQPARDGQIVTIKILVRNVGSGPAQGARLACGAGRTRAMPQMLPGTIGPGQTRAVSCQVAIAATTRATQIGIAVTVQGDANAGNNQRVLVIQPPRRSGR